MLEKVTEPTEWVNSFVIVEKVIDSSNAHSPNHSIKKSIRLCIDPKDLNEALEREPYYSRSIDELISMFAGAKVFTIVLGYHADTPITIKAEPSIWPTAAFINIHEHLI